MRSDHLAAMALIAMAGVDELPFEHGTSAKSKPVGQGRIVGRDMGGKRKEPKIGRNTPCPCGSGRKCKKCCGGK